DVTSLAGKDGTADVEAIAQTRHADLLHDGVVAVPREPPDLLRNGRHERVGDDVALVVHHQDIGDAGEPFPPFVNHRLDGRRVPVEEDFDAGAGDAFGNGLALALELRGQVPVDAPGQEAGHDQDGDTEQSDQNQQRPG